MEVVILFINDIAYQYLHNVFKYQCNPSHSYMGKAAPNTLLIAHNNALQISVHCSPKMTYEDEREKFLQCASA